MRIVHYYRDCAHPSGVTHAIDVWQEAVMSVGIDAVLLHNEARVQRDLPHRSIRHVGRGRQGEVPALSSHLRPGDVLVLHEGWVTSSHAAAGAARRAGIPYVVVPHGVYQPQILADLKAPRMVRFAREQRYLASAAAIHSFYSPEHTLAECSAGRPLPRLVAPTGFDLPDEAWTGGGGYLSWHGRYSPHHKGLDRLLRTYALTASADVPPLYLHGNDYQGGLARVTRLVSELQLEHRVRVGGMLRGADKADFLRRCDGYLFPSRWESHSISLLEALSVGAPVLLQDDLHASGWIVGSGSAIPTDFDDHPRAAHEMVRLLSATDVGARARAFVADELAWSRVLPRYLSSMTDIGSEAR